jgi:uncharacterized protein (DUF2236 family)
VRVALRDEHTAAERLLEYAPREARLLVHFRVREHVRERAQVRRQQPRLLLSCREIKGMRGGADARCRRQGGTR